MIERELAQEIQNDLRRARRGILYLEGRKTGLVADLDVEREFRDILRQVEHGLATGLDEAHALVNGKWFVEALAADRTRKSRERCREAWIGYVRSCSGRAEVRDFWARITGRSP